MIFLLRFVVSMSKPQPAAIGEFLLRGVLAGHPTSLVRDDNRMEVREFLISRRAKITPGDDAERTHLVNLTRTADGTNTRTPPRRCFGGSPTA